MTDYQALFSSRRSLANIASSVQLPFDGQPELTRCQESRSGSIGGQGVKVQNKINDFGLISFALSVHRTINVQYKRDYGAFGPLGRMQNQ